MKVKQNTYNKSLSEEENQINRIEQIVKVIIQENFLK